MSRLKALYASFVSSYEVTFIRQHAVLLTVCGAVVALAAICVLGVQ